MKSLEELKALRDKMKSATDNRAVAGADEVVIKVGMATCGIAASRRRDAWDCAVWNPSWKYLKTGKNSRMF